MSTGATPVQSRKVTFTMRISQFVGEARRGFWHLRQGGPAQLRSWWRRRRFREDSTATLSTRDSWNPLGVDEYTPLPLAKSFGSIRAAVILDDFSLLAWGCEFDTVAVTPESWRETVDSGIDLLLVESAWNANGGAWQYQLTGPSAPSAALQELTAYCRERQIPTIFWNKEDPPHFEDFLETAQLFDVVFTTDANKGNLKKISDEVGGIKSYVLPDGVGGRFSQLCPVGLLPAAVLGIDIKGLLAGAAYMDHVCRFSSMRKNPALMCAVLQIAAME